MSDPPGLTYAIGICALRGFIGKYMFSFLRPRIGLIWAGVVAGLIGFFNGNDRIDNASTLQLPSKSIIHLPNIAKVPFSWKTSSDGGLLSQNINGEAR